MSDLLKRVAYVSVSATRKFVPKDHIKSANVVFVNNNFKSLFLNKVEENVPAGKLVVSELKKASLDAPIMRELGERKKVFLAHFFELLERQSKGQPGILPAKGHSIIGYIPDDEGNPWAMRACWFDCHHGWHVNIYSTRPGFPGEWGAGDQVLSCK